MTHAKIIIANDSTTFNYLPPAPAVRPKFADTIYNFASLFTKVISVG